MAFVKEESEKFMDEFEMNKEEWEYLTKLGVRDIFGWTIPKKVLSLVVDRERNYYLIPRGIRNRNDTGGGELHFEALCIDGMIIYIEVEKKYSVSSMDGTYKTYKFYWDVKKIEFPENWKDKGITDEELIDILKEAHVAESYSKYGWHTPERIREVTVTVSALS